MTAQQLLQWIIDASSLGALYAALALGIVLVFGIMGLVNFAHGEIIMVSAYALVLVSPAPLTISIPVALTAAVALSVLMERIAFRPLRGAAPSTLMVASFAVGIVLQNLAISTMGAHARSVALSGLAGTPIQIGTIKVNRLSLITLIATSILLVGFATYLRRSSLGLQMRACAEDFETARMLGVRANRVIAAAFALGGLLAGFVAVLLLARSGTASPVMGLGPLIVGVVGMVLGGMSSLYAAALGGFLLGVLSVTLQVSLPLDVRPFRDAILFSLVILMLLFRPEGLFVRRAKARV